MGAREEHADRTPQQGKKGSSTHIPTNRLPPPASIRLSLSRLSAPSDGLHSRSGMTSHDPASVSVFCYDTRKKEERG